MKRLGGYLLGTLAVLLVVGWLAFQWFAADWFSTPNCDTQTSPDRCGQVSAPGPGGR